MNDRNSDRYPSPWLYGSTCISHTFFWVKFLDFYLLERERHYFQLSTTAASLKYLFTFEFKDLSRTTIMSLCCFAKVIIALCWNKRQVFWTFSPDLHVAVWAEIARRLKSAVLSFDLGKKHEALRKLRASQCNDVHLYSHQCCSQKYSLQG